MEDKPACDGRLQQVRSISRYTGCAKFSDIVFHFCFNNEMYPLNLMIFGMIYTMQQVAR